MTQRIHVAAIAAGLVAAGLGGRHLFGSSSVDVIDVEPGTPVEIRFAPNEAPPPLRVRVGAAASVLRIWTEDANADVVLRGVYGESPTESDYESFELQSSDDWVDEELAVHLTDAYALEAGEWYFWTPLSDWQDPGVLDGEVRLTVHCELVVPLRRPLELDRPVTVTVTRREGLLAAFECEVPRELVLNDAPLRIEVHSDRADVDLVVGPRLASQTYWSSYFEALSSRSFERRSFGAAECGRRFAVLAFAYPEYDGFDELEITVLLARDTDDAPTLCPAPRVPEVVARGPLEGALAATVSLVAPYGSGSGVVVSRRGHVLTNAHVVSGAQLAGNVGGDLAPVSVAFDMDGADSTAPTLGARLLEYDEERDLALLVIDTDLLRRPLADDVRFPHLARRAPNERPRIGDDVWCVGYPMTGGTHSFITVSATRGVVSGFARDSEGRKFKVDAGIHSGMSGGACVDAEGRLLGLPSSTVTDYDVAGSLGFVIPLENVPAAWWEHVTE